MEGLVAGRKPSPGRAIREATDAARRLEALGCDRPTIIAVHPVARLNPFQALLYRRAWDHGFAPIPLFAIDELQELGPLPGLGVRAVLHLHWTNKVLEGAPDEAAGRAAIDAFLARIDAFIADGGRLVWTVHNVVPHDARMPGLETELQTAIVERAAVVHVLVRATPDSVAGGSRLPADRLLHVPHPSYAGAYPDLVSRAEARDRLGLEPDETVALLLGAIKPYKGLTEALDAFDALLAADPRPRRLVVAGRPDEAPETRAFIERCAAHPHVTLHARRIDADEMQLFLNASDVAVLPYQRTLNSGVLLLALTFGLPVVVPGVASFKETVDSSIARFFVPGDTGSLAEAIRAADELVTPERRAATRSAALAIAARNDPDVLSAAFVEGLRERLG
jgi:beta-1,4-mannosyltransferase